MALKEQYAVDLRKIKCLVEKGYLASSYPTTLLLHLSFASWVPDYCRAILKETYDRTESDSVKTVKLDELSLYAIILHEKAKVQDRIKALENQTRALDDSVYNYVGWKCSNCGRVGEPNFEGECYSCSWGHFVPFVVDPPALTETVSG